MQQTEAQQLPSGCGTDSRLCLVAQHTRSRTMQCFNVLVDECVDAALQ